MGIPYGHSLCRRLLDWIVRNVFETLSLECVQYKGVILSKLNGYWVYLRNICMWVWMRIQSHFLFKAVYRNGLFVALCSIYI